MIGFDPLYFLFIGPAMLLAAWAQLKVKSSFAHASQIRPSNPVSGAEVAAQILRAYGISNVSIEQVQGQLSDHYDPRAKVLRLSPDVYHGRSLAALGVAAHEVGHALQDAKGYAPLSIRNACVPLASFGSNASWFLMLFGFILNSLHLIMIGIAAFSMVVLFQLVNLPVEFDASKRAKEILVQKGFISPQEREEVSSVLNAAAWTYVAGTLTSVLTLLYYLWRSGLLGGSQRD
ncbi:MAG: zinc metallopeptidase [Bdellovibrionales bacterium]|nr:zinc metallopeptidase [Bdellovibrionales bacterium]